MIRAIGATAIVCAFAGICAWSSGWTIAHAAPPAAVASIDPAQATVGDRLRFTIVATHDDGTDVEGPGFGGDFGGLDVIEVAASAAEERDGSVTTTLAYTLAAFRAGRFEVPPQRVLYRRALGDETLETNGLSVTIESVLQPGDTGLRPLKPQIDIKQDAHGPLAPVALVAGFAALTAFGYVLHWRAASIRPPDLRTAAAVNTPAADTSALLDQLAASDLGERDVREHYARLANSVRRHLTERFGLPAFAMTRTELAREMVRAGIDRWPARITSNLVEQCDAVQFAGFRPPPERRSADLAAAYEIVRLTTSSDDRREAELQAAPVE